MVDIYEKIAAGEPLKKKALQAVRRHEEAKGVKPDEEVERLRRDAESLMSAVQEYQFRVLGGPARSLH
ncbi:hypothetical protein [Pseudomonas fluorescens]|uniref:Uncharacterized protein n=1 Tax=Pseudomonas fluorescens TaxID=294 RepID=A0A5E6ZKM3_PSEFL|nr:hypothetical protein [Pseudomonas fluorescens]VVN64731.1 hypothetical protein PS723_00018 [Pseudomonas fluorescens]